MTVEISVLGSVKRALKDRTRVRFHVGTAELFANVRTLGAAEIAPGEKAFAQLYLNEPAVAVWNQPFVIRLESPVETIGGGRTANASRIKKPSDVDLEMLGRIASSNVLDRASAGLYFYPGLDWQPMRLSKDAGVADPIAASDSLKASGDLIEVEVSPTRKVTIHKRRFEELARRMLNTLKRMHELKPLRFQHPRTAVEHEFDYLGQPELLALVIDHLKRQKQVVANVNSIGLVGYGPKLSKGQKTLLDQLIQSINSAGVEPPTVADLIKSAKKNKESVEELLDMAAENGDLIRITKGFYLHAAALAEIKNTLTNALQETPAGLTMSDIRTLLATTRKYAIPILEFLDETGFTIRDGDMRQLAG
jgi:selenocysteine-specific elongation factor